jgi:hypothetical protein
MLFTNNFTFEFLPLGHFCEPMKWVATQAFKAKLSQKRNEEGSGDLRNVLYLRLAQ